MERGRQPKIDIRKVDQDRQRRPLRADGRLEPEELSVDEGGVSDDLRDAHVRHVLRTHHRAKAERRHAAPAEPKESGGRD